MREGNGLSLLIFDAITTTKLTAVLSAPGGSRMNGRRAGGGPGRRQGPREGHGASAAPQSARGAAVGSLSASYARRIAL